MTCNVCSFHTRRETTHSCVGSRHIRGARLPMKAMRSSTSDFCNLLALSAGFDRVKDHLASVQRPLHSLCGMELRSPKPFSFQGFSDFNSGYVRVLAGLGTHRRWSQSGCSHQCRA